LRNVFQFAHCTMFTFFNDNYISTLHNVQKGEFMAYDKVKYNNEYNKQKYERLNIHVPKGMKEYIEARALDLGYRFINPYVNSLIYADLASNEKEKLEADEQLILNLYRYGNDDIKKQLYDLALKIDNGLSQDEKKKMFEDANK